MTADPRVTAAREFLAGARRRKIGELPPSVLQREAAESRRQLGLVLDLIGEDGTVLSGAELQIVMGALGHGAVFLEERAARPCDDCATHPAGPCESHVDDLDGADVDDLDGADDYRLLAARLGPGRAAAAAVPDGALAALRAEVVSAIDVALACSAAARQLGAIRAVLAGFDWELDDRQLALERIERIAAGSEGR